MYGKLGLSLTDYMGPGVLTRWLHIYSQACDCHFTISFSLYLLYFFINFLSFFLSFFLPRCSVHVTSITFGISIGLTAVALIVERNEGLIDRTWVAGVSVSEIIISQVVTQVFILLVQITLLVTVVLFGFKVQTLCHCVTIRHCATV